LRKRKFMDVLNFWGTPPRPMLSPSLKETCFVKKKGKRNFFTIKPVAMWKISVSLLISYIIFISHFTTTVRKKRKEKKKRLLLPFFSHSTGRVACAVWKDAGLVQCEEVLYIWLFNIFTSLIIVKSYVHH
jgi:hypothetical protein